MKGSVYSRIKLRGGSNRGAPSEKTNETREVKGAEESKQNKGLEGTKASEGDGTEASESDGCENSGESVRTILTE